MDYRTLGPLDVARPGSGPVKIEGAKTRALLVLLLLSRNSLVPVDRIADQLWSGTPPPSAAATIHAYVSRLRRALAGPGGPQQSPLVTRKPGYLLQVASGEYDVDRFERLVRLAADASPEEAAALLGEALALWRGPALAEFAHLSFAGLEAARLDELRLVAIERHAEAELARSRHGELVGGLERLVAENPLRESLTGLLMIALYRSGRQADALGAYQAAYRRLAEEIGVLPGPRLRALEAAILNHDPSLDPPVAASAPASTPRAPLPAGLVRLRDQSPLIGREAELRLLARAWSRLGPAGCRLLAVSGEAGIGKSRLVAELAGTLHEEGAAVLWGRALEPQLVPYQPFVEALGDHLAARGPKQTADLAKTAGRALSWLLPDLADAPGTAEPAEPGARRYLMFEAVAAVLAELAEAAGLVLILEDLHLADPSVLSMVEHVVRRARRGPMAVVVTLDDALADASESAESLPKLLARLGRDGLLERVALAGLAEGEVAALMAWAGGGQLRPARSVVRAVHERTQGNPLFVEELVRDGDVSEALPARIRDLVSVRLARLDPDLLEVLQAASLLGAEFEADVLASLLGRPAGTVGAALDRAVSARLVDDLTREPRRLRFVQQVVHDAARASMPEPRVTELRRRLVDSLAGMSDRADYYAVLAHHFRLSSYEDAHRSLAYSQRAGDYALERLGFAEAVRHYQSGLDTLASLSGGDLRRERCELLLGLGTAQRALYQRLATQEAFQAAAKLAIDLADPRLLVRAAWGLLTTSEFSATSPAVVEVFRQGLAALEPGDTPARVALTTGLGRALPPGPEAVASGRTAIEMARRLGDPEAILFAVGGGVLTIWAPDNLEERIALSSEAIATGHEQGWVELAHEARVWRSACAEELGEQAAAEADLAAVRQWAQDSRQPFFLAITDMRDAARALCEGRYAEAEKLANAAVEGSDAGPDFQAGWAAQIFGLRRDQGRLAELDALLTDLVADSSRVPGWLTARAVADVELARLDSARAILDSFAADGFAGLPRDWLWLSAAGHLADCCADLAFLGVPAPEAAEGLYRLLEPYAARFVVLAHGVLNGGAAARQLGGLAAALGHYDEAIRHFESATAGNQARGAVPWAARAQLGHADALLRRGRPGDLDLAASLVRQADAAIAAVGAEGLAWRSRLLGQRMTGVT
ncbi:AAA family ATPase [Streptosporangiaceae bacterium NEAU-GS5]|nr:AAA family ATPase [Streptosporangiaceae bacterium NEAU-GS5]